MPGSYADATGVARERPHTFRSSTGRPRADYEPWLAVPSVRGQAPVVRDHVVVRPEFCANRESFIGSYAFSIEGPPMILLTALHVLGPLIQAKGVDCSMQNTTYTGSEVPQLVTQVRLFDAFAANWARAPLGAAGPMLVLPEARIGEEEPCSQRDIAAFRVAHTARLAAAKLAARPPKVGDPIWVAAKSRGPNTARTLSAVVVEQSENTLIFRYATTEPLPPHTSGAPLLDEHGDVVGINVGAGVFDGRRFGHGNHVTSIRRHLRGLANVA